MVTYTPKFLDGPVVLRTSYKNDYSSGQVSSDEHRRNECQMINNLWKGIQQSLILDRVNSDLIEISFWGKIDADDTSIAERQDVRGKK